MSDLEELVREELRARAAAADEQHPADSAAALLGGLDRRIGVARLRRRWTAAGLSAVAVTAAVALQLTLLAPAPEPGPPSGPAWPSPARPGPRPLSDSSLTPPGWTPLTYRDAQISVPSSWVVQGPRGSICNVTTGGGVVFGRQYYPTNNDLCGLPPTTVFVSALHQMPREPPRQRLNGIPVIRQPTLYGGLSYVAPSLGVEVTAAGPKARQVIATLTRAPRSVALAPGRPLPVPSGWRWHDFGGIVFAAPGTWQVKRTRKWGNCVGRPVQRAVLTLSTATEFGCRGPLASPLGGLARDSAPITGMSVGAGRVAADAATPGQYWRCIRLHRVRTCIPQQGNFVGVFLELIMYLPGRPIPTVVNIGLAGTGATTRAILDSIKPR